MCNLSLLPPSDSNTSPMVSSSSKVVNHAVLAILGGSEHWWTAWVECPRLGSTSSQMTWMERYACGIGETARSCSPSTTSKTTKSISQSTSEQLMEKPEKSYFSTKTATSLTTISWSRRWVVWRSPRSMAANCILTQMPRQPTNFSDFLIVAWSRVTNSTHSIDIFSPIQVNMS